MVIGIFGENCTGKSALAAKLKDQLNAQVYTGKDYLRLEKNEPAAKRAFQEKLTGALQAGHIVYVISEKDQLALLPKGSVRVLATADLEEIKARFAQRMRGNLPAPVAAMLERKHGCFDAEPHEIHMVLGQTDLDGVCEKIAGMNW